jgi:hypothetical protein
MLQGCSARRNSAAVPTGKGLARFIELGGSPWMCIGPGGSQDQHPAACCLMSLVANDDAISELRSGHVGDIHLIEFTVEAEAGIFEHAYDFMAVHRQKLSPAIRRTTPHAIRTTPAVIRQHI